MPAHKAVAAMEMIVDNITVSIKLPGQPDVRFNRPPGVTTEEWYSFWNAEDRRDNRNTGQNFNHEEAERRHAQFERERGEDQTHPHPR